MKTPIMEDEDITVRLKRELVKRAARILHLRNLLAAVHDAGRPHSHLCGCDCCLAFEAVRKELRGE